MGRRTLSIAAVDPQAEVSEVAPEEVAPEKVGVAAWQRRRASAFGPGPFDTP